MKVSITEELYYATVEDNLVIGYQTETQNMHCFGNKKLGPLFTGRAILRGVNCCFPRPNKSR